MRFKSVDLKNRCCVLLVFFVIDISGQTPVNNADVLFQKGNFIAAINQYAKVNNRHAKLQIARAYNAIGNYDKAMLQYEDLIIRDPSLEIAPFELGKIYLKIHKSDLAEKQFTQLTIRGTENPEYFYYQGVALSDLDRIKEGVMAFKNAVVIDNTHLRSIFQLGKYYVAKQERDSVLYFIDRGLDFYPNDVALVNLKALTYFNDSSYAKAAKWFEKLLSLGEYKAYIFQKLGYSYTKLWEFEKAKDAYNDLLGFEKSVPNAYNGLGAVFWKEKKLDSAAIYFREAIKAKNPNLAQEYNALAGLAREQNKLKSALHYYKLAYQEDETNYRAYYQLCTVMDQITADPQEKLVLYKNFILKFGAKKTYISKMVKERIIKLKEEIRLNKDSIP